MERVQQEITEALCELLNPGGIYLRNNGSVRQLEGLEDDEKCVFGDVPETTELIENELKFTIPLYSGQKTGWFYDHGKTDSYSPDCRRESEYWMRTVILVPGVSTRSPVGPVR